MKTLTQRLILTLFVVLLAVPAAGQMAMDRFAKNSDSTYVRLRTLSWTVPEGSGHTGLHAVTWSEAMDDQSGLWNPATPKKITVPPGYTEARVHVLWQRNLGSLDGGGILYATVSNIPGAVGGATSIDPNSRWIDQTQGHWFQVQNGDGIRLAFDLWNVDSLFDTIHFTIELR